LRPEPFTAACCDRIVDRLLALVERSKVARTSNGRELVVIKDAAIKQFMKDNNIRIHTHGADEQQAGARELFAAGWNLGVRIPTFFCDDHVSRDEQEEGDPKLSEVIEIIDRQIVRTRDRLDRAAAQLEALGADFQRHCYEWHINENRQSKADGRPYLFANPPLQVKFGALVGALFAELAAAGLDRVRIGVQHRRFVFGNLQFLVANVVGVHHRGRLVECRQIFRFGRAVLDSLREQRLDLFNDRIAVGHHAASALSEW
jgi:hypothetical protein